MKTLTRTSLLLAVVIAVAAPAQAQTTDDFHSVAYARLGYGTVAGERGAPAIGFGYRGELNSFALDVSFFNLSLGSGLAPDTAVSAGSILKLAVLRFASPESDRTMYYGGGLSWGVVSLGRASTATEYASSWTGSGLQGEASVGYEFARRSPVRMFVQADLGVPFFRARSQSYTFTRGSILSSRQEVDSRYLPSAVVSVGIGWNRHR
jgi:hypothetical protein